MNWFCDYCLFLLNACEVASWNMGGLEATSSRATCQKPESRQWRTTKMMKGLDYLIWEGRPTCLGCKNKMKACFKHSQALISRVVTRMTEINHSFWQQQSHKLGHGKFSLDSRKTFRRRGAARLKLVSWRNARVSSMVVFGTQPGKVSLTHPA